MADKPNPPKKRGKKATPKRTSKSVKVHDALDWYLEGMPVRYIGPSVIEDGVVILPRNGTVFVAMKGTHQPGKLKCVLDSHRTNREDTDVFFIARSQLEPIQLPELPEGLFDHDR